MRRYNIVFRILLIAPFVVAAPVLVQEKRQAGVVVEHIPAITALGKRGIGSESEEMVLNLFGQSHFLHKSEELSPTHLSSSTPPSRSPDDPVSTNVEQPLLSISKGPSPAFNLFGEPPRYFLAKPEGSSFTHLSSSSSHAPPSPGNEPNKRPVLLNLFGDPGSYVITKPEGSQATYLSSSLGHAPPNRQLLNLLGEPPGYFLAKPEGSSAAYLSSSSYHAPLGSGGDSNKKWLNLFGDPGSYIFAKPEKSSTDLSSSSQLPGPADGWTDLDKPLSPIPEESSPVSSPDDTPPSPGSLTESGYELMKGEPPPGPSESGSASSTISSADHESMGSHTLPNSGPSTESDHQMVGVPLSSSSWSLESDHEIYALPSSSVSLENPDSQWMGLVSSSGKRKRP